MLGYVTRYITLIIGIALHCIACCQEGANAKVSLKNQGSKGFYERKKGFKLPVTGVIRVLIVGYAERGFCRFVSTPKLLDKKNPLLRFDGDFYLWVGF